MLRIERWIKTLYHWLQTHLCVSSIASVLCRTKLAKTGTFCPPCTCCTSVLAWRTWDTSHLPLLTWMTTLTPLTVLELSVNHYLFCSGLFCVGGIWNILTTILSSPVPFCFKYQPHACALLLLKQWQHGKNISIKVQVLSKK